ncbi:MAG TPA: nickel pincer cofactor biosynthesis protein LarB [Opitutaceae bacterium]|nr:nickel pincer cofactor biosynthesis protein LarB [Opitutaceae bacterium]
MNRAALANLLDRYRTGVLTLDAALAELKDFPSADLGYALIDNHRALRTGHPEVIYCAGKTPAQVRGILERMLTGANPILATRAEPAHWDAARDLSPSLAHDPLSRTIVRRPPAPAAPPTTYVAIVAAGTSDLPVAEEAAITAEVFGNRVERVYDVGVAGLHRLLGRLEKIRQARAIVAVAGMEGALPSVLGGLVDRPIVAVPTSIGYGASFGGIAALLAMLNSCAPGVTVVNIDNGFGAGYAASTINRLG